MGADTLCGVRPQFTGGPGAAGPPSEVQCKGDAMYTQRVWVLFSLLLCFLQLLTRMHGLLAAATTPPWALLPCRVKGQLLGNSQNAVSALFF